MIIREYLTHITYQFQKAGIDTARLDARILVCEALDWSLEKLVAHDERIITTEKIAQCDTLVQRRLLREPVSHILGKKEFWGREFKVTRDTLTPRPDSEILIETALEYLADFTSPNILDLGTGTGCLLLSLLAECPRAKGCGIDISNKALAVAKENAERLGCQDRATWIESDWLQALDKEKKFDLIIANPPYIAEDDRHVLAPEVVQYEPAKALFAGVDGLNDYRTLASSLAGRTADDGNVMFEIGKGQQQKVVSLMTQEGFELAGFYEDLAGVVRCLVFGKQER